MTGVNREGPVEDLESQQIVVRPLAVEGRDGQVREQVRVLGISFNQTGEYLPRRLVVELTHQTDAAVVLRDRPFVGNGTGTTGRETEGRRCEQHRQGIACNIGDIPAAAPCL